MFYMPACKINPSLKWGFFGGLGAVYRTAGQGGTGH